MARYSIGGGEQENSERKPPTMTRSMRQLATVYSPGALFTWEGGLGACRAVAIPTRAMEMAAATRDLIREQIQEFLDSWLDRGRAGNYPNGVAPNEARLVDARLLRNGRPEVTEDKLAFVAAEKIGYEPFPLSFVCRRCDLHRFTRDVTTLVRDQTTFSQDCPNKKTGKECHEDWEQLDVVMVHWSGAVEAITPIRQHWDVNKKELLSFSSCNGCGGKNFKLLRKSTQFAGWKFECIDCGTSRPILMSDEFTYRSLGDEIAAGLARQAEVNMEPISYRASSAYYSQSDRVLVFKESEWLNLLQPSKLVELKTFLGRQYDYPGQELNDDEKKELLRKAGKLEEWNVRQDLVRTAASLPPSARGSLLAAIAQYDERWAKEVFTTLERGSANLAAKCVERSKFIRRFDPIRMAVEHKTLSHERLRSTAKVDGRDACVDVVAPDKFLLPDGANRDEVIGKVREKLRLLGIDEMRLIRDLQVCEFSFGYTRVSSTPTMTRPEKAGNQDLPVKLNMFDKITSNERPGFPVYCLQQANEAFYIRLDESVVCRWLEKNAIPVDSVRPSEKLGGLLIEQYQPFSRFLDDYRREKTMPREAYPYVYSLLHSMAHQFIGVMSELSGLDIGSFGEHLLVPDLAFLVYRRGVTMDLGNLSSMWRNHGDAEHGNEVLQKMLRPETLRCGAETICMTLRGGACPDCILIPENACLTRNELLSRSFLIGRGVPRWDQNEAELVGFYDVVRERAQAG